MYLVLYKNEFEWAEKYKVLKDEKWPWYTDPNFSEKCWKAIYISLFNTIVVNNAFQALFFYMNDWKPYVSMARDDLPSPALIVK